MFKDHKVEKKSSIIYFSNSLYLATLTAQWGESPFHAPSLQVFFSSPNSSYPENIKITSNVLFPNQHAVNSADYLHAWLPNPAPRIDSWQHKFVRFSRPNLETEQDRICTNNNRGDTSVADHNNSTVVFQPYNHNHDSAGFVLKMMMMHSSGLWGDVTTVFRSVYQLNFVIGICKHTITNIFLWWFK